MFKHEKMLFHPVAVEKPNPQYAALLQEQLGGGNGELKAAMQYMSQSFRIKDPEIKDLFLDIAAEELGHMEMVAQTINLLKCIFQCQTRVLIHLRQTIQSQFLSINNIKTAKVFTSAVLNNYQINGIKRYLTFCLYSL